MVKSAPKGVLPQYMFASDWLADGNNSHIRVDNSSTPPFALENMFPDSSLDKEDLRAIKMWDTGLDADDEYEE